MSPIWSLPLFAGLLAPPVQRWIGRAVTPLLRIPAGAEALVFVSSLLVGAAPFVMGRFPLPYVHDEIAYLLGADTFLHGRLTNPTPLFSEHFETIHQLVQPSYQSKFPPGQSIALAAGALVGGVAVGVFGTVALACAALTWALRAALPARWALLGGLWAALHPTVVKWSQSYWGGGVALLGGALFVGALLRLSSPRAKAVHGAVLAVGMAILANSRPLEGLLLCVISLPFLILRKRQGFARPLLAAAVVLLPCAVWMGYYNHRVTGRPWRFPYTEHRDQYIRIPLLWWEDPRAVAHSPVAKIRAFHEEYEFSEYQKQATLKGFVEGVKSKIQLIGTASFIPEPMTLPFAAAPLLGLPAALMRRRLARVALVILSAFVLAHFLVTPWLRIQYFAAAGAVLVLLVALSLRELSRWRVGRLCVGAAIALASLGMLLAASAVSIQQILANPSPRGTARAELVRSLEEFPGDHLVFVRYGRGPHDLFEWVYNSADIVGQRAIFAHSLAPRSDHDLWKHFAARTSWLLKVDGTETSFEPYEP